LQILIRQFKVDDFDVSDRSVTLWNTKKIGGEWFARIIEWKFVI